MGRRKGANAEAFILLFFFFGKAKKKTGAESLALKPSMQERDKSAECKKNRAAAAAQFLLFSL